MSSSNAGGSKQGHVCPWWLAYTFDNPIRKLFQDPRKMLASYVKEGMRVMDVGCGMGFFSIGMAQLIGEQGRVFSVDLQPRMLATTAKRARRAGVDHRLELIQCTPDNLGISEKMDFILTFYMVHEVSDQRHFFKQLKSCLAPGGQFLTAEPRFHVSAVDFQKTIEAAQTCGFQLSEHPSIRFSHSALFK
jgi:ubiquinone/menaquinone biosynthesis C-methylase UbiE